MSLEFIVNWLQNVGEGSAGTGAAGYTAFMDSQLLAAIFEDEPNKWGGVIEGFNCSLSGTNVVVTAGRAVNFCDSNLSRGPYVVSGVGTSATVPITNTGPTSGTRIDQILVEVSDTAENAVSVDDAHLIIKPGQISQSIEAQDPFPDSTLVGIITWSNGTPVVSAGPRNTIGTRQGGRPWVSVRKIGTPADSQAWVRRIDRFTAAYAVTVPTLTSANTGYVIGTLGAEYPVDDFSNRLTNTEGAYQVHVYSGNIYVAPTGSSGWGYGLTSTGIFRSTIP